MKKIGLVVLYGALFIALAIAIYFVIKTVIKIQYVRDYEVGKCYVIINDNPFEKYTYYIKVVDKKDKYVKYLLNGKYLSSSTARFITNVYEKEVNCGDLEEKE